MKSAKKHFFLPAARGLSTGLSGDLALPGLALAGLNFTGLALVGLPNLCLLETVEMDDLNSIDVAVFGGGVGLSFLSGGALLGRGTGDSDLYSSVGSNEGTAETRSVFGNG